ncbi:MAG: PDZ domain-containing protein [Pirellulales bacterium]|nr:PDZ domain-containing protein [Pirellulales bacterium]
MAVSSAHGEELDLLEQKAFQAAVARVAPSVVRIEMVGGLERVGDVPFGAGPTTGLVVSEDGYIVSSTFHFVNEPSSILVQLPGQARKPAQLVATDHNRMLVLLKIETDQPLPVPEAAPTEETRVGQWAIAVGRTFAGDRPNMAVGLVSALGRVWGKAIQTDTAVSPNNYGGPLVDIRGRVLGVLTPMSPESSEEIAGYQWYDSGIGFAVPLRDVLDVVPRMKRDGDLRPGLLGIGLGKDTLYAEAPVVATVRPNSPAFKAGIKSGDRIARIDGRPVPRLVQFKSEIARRYAGDTVRLAVVRDEKETECEAPLVAELEPYQHPFLGVLPMRTAAEAKDKPQGVTVRFVYPDSPAAKAGVEPGDVLLSVDGKAIAEAKLLRQAISERSVGDAVELEFRRRDETKKVKLDLASQPENAPAGPLPPAHATVKPGDQPDEKKEEAGKPAQPAMFKMKTPELTNEAWAYVPQRTAPPRPYGLVVWLHAPGGLDEKALLAQWKPHCDRDGLVLLAPKAADPDKWSLSELEFIRKLKEELENTYPIDPARVVVAGRQGGGAIAYLVAFQGPADAAAVIAVDAPTMGRLPENEPSHRLAFCVARAAKSEFAKRVEASITQLRKQKYPVTVMDLGEDPRELNAEELTELARWIDSLDRI